MTLFIILFVIFLILILVFLRYGGLMLVQEDSLNNINNSTIVLLMGSVADRSLGAAKLYKKDIGKNIVMVRSYIAGNEILQKKGIEIKGHADNSKMVLSKLGVDQRDIIILSGDAKSTKDEALVIADYIKEVLDVNSIVIVTSKYHSYRSKLIFNKVLKNLDVTIYSAPTAFDPFKAKGWYKSREDAKYLVREYMKLTHYFLLEQFHIK